MTSSLEGLSLTSACDDEVVRLWEPTTGPVRSAYLKDEDSVFSVVCSSIPFKHQTDFSNV